MDNNLKTGTTTIGVVCKDGIVLAADKRATAGNFIANRNISKIVDINDRIAVTTAGSVSDIQLVVKFLRAELNLKAVRYNRINTVKEAANLLAGMVYNTIRNFSAIPGVVHFLLAGNDNNGNHLYEIYPDGSISEIEDFVSSGSGSMMAYGVLESAYDKNITTERAQDLVIKALKSSLSRDSASGSGYTVVVINDKGVKRVIDKNIPAFN
ncbi:MAG: proteasome subunit beta [Candidatus Woesearchaeota archaeon]